MNDKLDTPPDQNSDDRRQNSSNGLDNEKDDFNFKNNPKKTGNNEDEEIIDSDKSGANNLQNTHEYNTELLLSEADRSAINYIKKQKAYLVTSGVFPIYTAAVNVINIRFVLYVFLENRIWIQRISDLLLPLFALFIISIFSIIQFSFLKIWNDKVKKYEHQKKLLDLITGTQETKDYKIKQFTLTNLFYDIIDHMEKIKKWFIMLNVICILYLIWGYDFFVVGIPISVSKKIVIFIYKLNVISFWGVSLYLVYEWMHFVRWFQKLRRIKSFEKQVFSELQLDNV